MFVNEFGPYKNVECGLVRIIQIPHKGPVNAPIPLKSVSIVASVVHAVAQVEITQVFVNEEKNPIEAIYFFPVDASGAVTHFQVDLENKTIKVSELKQANFLKSTKKCYC